ncbi:hypothetical protein Xen7305DRAFT_00021460 [Xenococcus sp. PCC 7305]|uniref:hypothetical protein n=1 Tax=Xenococcus sp. PCC 7305 TaxID=102125 RepID=UPI0002ACC761|nr:hypothetical protein [Xenococcus sp. PCC 7305]ELS02432.1 hypothetical protein Xen7305DRAFT_00021460 [Xenococcus sp. PCC 7305]
MIEKFSVVFVGQEDYQLSQDETMGTKSKFWFKHQELGRCLYKYIRPNTGEDWAEKVAEQICELLGLPHANYKLAETWDKNYGTVSPNFLPQGGALIHGNEILTPLIPNYPTYETYNASQHTIDVVINAIESSDVRLPPDWNALEGIETARDLFIGYILLDALIGNGDRHHENWGFVRIISTHSPDILYLSPTYDHASCLGRELLDSKRQTRSITSYAKKCVSAFYRDVNDKKPLGTFELFKELASRYPKTSEVWLNRLTSISKENINLILQAIPSERISPTAAKFAQDILIFNQNRLLSL